MKNSIDNIEILDCTLRDGGYYTNWDFSDELVDIYIDSLNSLPVKYIEIGYRSIPKNEYAGAYFYLPENLIQSIKNKTNKSLVIILDEKNVIEDCLFSLLDSCVGKIDIVRLAVDPEKIERATALIIKIKAFGFKVSINLMYASSWTSDLYENSSFDILNTHLDYFYVVDSYGSLYPEDVQQIFSKLNKILSVPLGFHGHNNLELALINSLTAIKAGASIIDATVTGMGRGAGNLKTELLLSILHDKNGLSLDFDILEELVNSFSVLKEKYNWGTNLPYMISGAFSMPQNTVMSKIKKRYHSINSIISENVSPRQNTISYSQDFPIFKPNKSYKSILVVGGGNSPIKNKKALQEFLRQNPSMAIIFVSSKNIHAFSNLYNYQFHCLIGKEGQRLEKMINLEEFSNKSFIIPPRDTSLESYVPSDLKEYTYAIEEVDFESSLKESATALAFQIVDDLNGENVFLTGYDGYLENIQTEEMELFKENHVIFDHVRNKGINLYSLTPTQYNLKSKSIYSLL